MSDPLAEFRRKDSAKTASERPAAAGGREPYIAFLTKDRVRALDILCKDGSGHSATYEYLLYVSWDRAAHESFFLVYGSLMVKVRGRNLREVIKALRLRKCEFLCEYSSDEFDLPDPAAPVITSIEVVKSPAANAMMEGVASPQQ
jgi:hypothetical protein